MTIGTRLKQARKAAQLTQVELAKRVGLNQSTLSDLEIGKSVGSTSLAALAHALGVNALWLETGRGEREAAKEQPQEQITFSESLDDIARTPRELILLSMYRLADEAERDAFDALADNVRRRLHSPAHDEAERRKLGRRRGGPGAPD